MKKWIINLVLTVWMLAVLLPVSALAANTNDKVQIANDGTVTISSNHAAAEGISSLQISLLVQPAEENAAVSFMFSDGVAEIAEYRYHADNGQLNLYLAGDKALFDQSGNLSVGAVTVQDQSGTPVQAYVSVVKDSLCYVYVTELKTEKAEIPEQPVTINAKQPTVPDQPTNPEQPANPEQPTNTAQPTAPVQTAKPEQPVTPVQTAKPATPGQSAKPTGPKQPAVPDSGNDDASKADAVKDLQETLEDAESYVAENYTDESYQAVEKAMEEAKTVLSSSTATEEELANARQNLLNAIGALVLSDTAAKPESNNGGSGSDVTDSDPGAASEPAPDEESGEKGGFSKFIWLFIVLLLLIVIVLWYLLKRRNRRRK